MHAAHNHPTEYIGSVQNPICSDRLNPKIEKNHAAQLRTTISTCLENRVKIDNPSNPDDHPRAQQNPHSNRIRPRPPRDWPPRSHMTVHPTPVGPKESRDGRNVHIKPCPHCRMLLFPIHGEAATKTRVNRMRRSSLHG